MARFSWHNKWILPGVLLFCFAALILLLIFLNLNPSLLTSQTQTPTSAGAQKPGNRPTNISMNRTIKAYASSGYTPASAAIDGNYDTSWRSVGSQSWLAYDLSGLPISQRQQVLVVWYNETLNYDHTLIKYLAYNLPENYTLEVNTAPGGGNPPTSGWKTLVSVVDNHYHSRQHIINMAGANWVRINITKVDGSFENFDTSINMGVYVASSATADDWIFYGDSITAGAMSHNTLGGVKSFSQLINQKAPTHMPVQEAGGTGYLTSLDGATNIGIWLPLFPGRYVGLSFGTNDALSCVDPAVFYNNYEVMVQAVLAAGKLPIIPHIPWGKAPSIQQCAPALNARIDMLYQKYPKIIKGPDFWAYFQNHPNLISSDKIHPSPVGFGVYRQQWADAMLQEVYK